MAAHAALVSLARLTNQILSQDQDYTFLCNKEQMKSLHEKTICLLEFLERILVRSRSSAVDAVEGRIRDVAYQLDYIIESIVCRLIDMDTQIYPRCTSVGEAGSHPSASMAPLAPVFSRCIIEIDILLEEVVEMNKPVKKSATFNSSTKSSLIGAPVAKEKNVGLNNETAQILDKVMGRASSLQIVPITGMGGIGKTTLARAVYDDSRLQHHFNVRLWVTFSQEYDIQEVLRGLLPTGQETQHSDGLIGQVYKYLKGRRFLIVLDDIWEGKAWDGIMNAFPDDNNRSRIILTTRLLGVASYVGSLSNVHEMHLLNEDQSWDILREKVYGEEPYPAELGDIGRTISKNCKGLPLAIVVIAGLLKRNNMKEYWKEVAKNTSAAAAMDYDFLLGILSLSYTNLPPQLKACFLYMGAFPEDFEYQTREFVMLWIAEGFVRPKKSKTMEETAEECLEELVERSLVLVKKYKYNGKIKTFIIHDVLRELIIRKAKEENFLSHYSTSPVQNIIKDQHRVSAYTSDLINCQYDTYDAHVRCLRYEISSGTPFTLESLPEKINRENPKEYSLGAFCKISSLRYLNVVNDVYGSIITFPKSISKLQNLETLIIKNQLGMHCVLPLDIWKLPRLRHFISDTINLQFPRLDSEGGGYSVLECLQTLCGVKDINLSMDVIERIPNVKKLRMVYRYVSFNFWQEFSISNLQYLHQLQVLSIRCWKFHDDYSRLPPTDLAFPHNLKELSLLNTHIPLENEYMSVLGLLPNLEVLKLKYRSVVGKTWEPNEGEFLQLKYLKMDYIHVEEWEAESVHFPCLEKLEIINCTNLKEVPESMGEIDTLQELVLSGCLTEAKESVLKIQENQQAFGNHSLKIMI